MKSISKFFIAALLAIILATVLFIRMDKYSKEFDIVVKEALETTDGYDQAFIDMVNRFCGNPRVLVQRYAIPAAKTIQHIVC